MRTRFPASLLLLCAWCSSGSAASAAAPLLHVPSPDWRDQVIYFLMIDRFANGDPGNDDQGSGEYDPADGRRFSGGDLAGIRQRLDYIQGLGASTVWITPPVANQWWQPAVQFGGYHGYWAEHFARVDAHFGTLADYQALSDALHRRGMYLVQDIVVNHTANYFSCAAPAVPGQACAGWRSLPDGRGRRAPTQPPFDRNDPRRAANRRAASYHWTPDITDYGQREQELRYQMSGLDDLDSANPAVRRALRASYGHWIRAAGVDGFRIDTAFFAPPAFFEDFMQSGDRRAPGMARVARATGRRAFLTFGEGFAIDPAHSESATAKIAEYQAGSDRLASMLNFPLYGSIGEVFARGRPTAELAHRIDSTLRHFARPHLMPSFVDNHDVDRWLAGGDEAGLRQALLLLYTLPGIPTIYYGTEQGFAEPRPAMFAGGYQSGGRDHYDTSARLYRYLRELADLRRQHRVLSRGTPVILAANAARAGVLAWRMDPDDGSSDQALVLFNSATAPALLDNLATGLPPGTPLRARLALAEAPTDAVVGAAGMLSRVLAPRSALVYQVGNCAPVPCPLAPVPFAPVPSAGPQLEPPIIDPAANHFMVHGRAVAGTALRIALDGDLSLVAATTADAGGRFNARIDTAALVDPEVEHSLTAWDETRGLASARLTFKIRRDWQPLAALDDPAGDDHGPGGRYVYPTDPSWRLHRQLDLRRIEVSGAGGALHIDVELNAITRSWNPQNGFDHVALTLFLELPGRAGGSRVMPLQQAELPDDMRWHRRLRVHGWSNALFAADGAGTRHEGTPVAPGATLEVDAAARRIRITLPAAALGVGSAAELRGARVYLNSWDYDGGYRSLSQQPGTHAFGGGDGSRDPLWLDAAGPIRL